MPAAKYLLYFVFLTEFSIIGSTIILILMKKYDSAKLLRGMSLIFTFSIFTYLLMHVFRYGGNLSYTIHIILGFISLWVLISSLIKIGTMKSNPFPYNSIWVSLIIFISFSIHSVVTFIVWLWESKKSDDDTSWIYESLQQNPFQYAKHRKHIKIQGWFSRDNNRAYSLCDGFTPIYEMEDDYEIIEELTNVSVRELGILLKVQKMIKNHIQNTCWTVPLTFFPDPPSRHYEFKINDGNWMNLNSTFSEIIDDNELNVLTRCIDRNVWSDVSINNIPVDGDNMLHLEHVLLPTTTTISQLYNGLNLKSQNQFHIEIYNDGNLKWEFDISHQTVQYEPDRSLRSVFLDCMKRSAIPFIGFIIYLQQSETPVYPFRKIKSQPRLLNLVSGYERKSGAGKKKKKDDEKKDDDDHEEEMKQSTVNEESDEHTEIVDHEEEVKQSAANDEQSELPDDVYYLILRFLAPFYGGLPKTEKK